MKRFPNLHYAKAFYFFYFGAWASLLPFIALYFRSLGFNGSQIGLLAGISPFITLFAAPFWSGLADATQRHRRLLIGAIAATSVLVLILSQVSAFWVIIPVVVGYSFFSAPILPLVDSTVIHLLGADRARYGRQRLWGAIGWGVAGPAAGWLVEQFGLPAIFPVYLILFTLTLVSVLGLQITPSEGQQPFWKGLNTLLANRRWFLFLLVAYLSGSGMGVLNNFLFLYMDELHAGSTIMGLALAVATISEIPVLFYSNWMLRRWGPRGLLILSLAAYVLRAFGYSLATQPWQAVLLQLFHGLTFSAMWVAGVNFAGETAPPGLGATAQGLFTSTIMGLGGITGAIAGGYLLDVYGGAGMFRVTAAVVLVGLIVFLLSGKSLSRTRQPA